MIGKETCTYFYKLILCAFPNVMFPLHCFFFQSEFLDAKQESLILHLFLTNSLSAVDLLIFWWQTHLQALEETYRHWMFRG